MLNIGEILQLQHDSYQLINIIGQGAYSSVWEAKRISDKTSVAVKSVQYKNPIDGTPYPRDIIYHIVNSQEREISFLKKITAEHCEEHNVLPLIDFGEYQSKPISVLPKCDSTFNHIYQQRINHPVYNFTVDRLLTWVEQISRALKFIHTVDSENELYVYRDLKPSNILLRNEIIYLSDFTTYKVVTKELTFSLAGTPSWAAPEILIPKKIETNRPIYYITPATDIYSFGLILFGLLNGTLPSSQHNLHNYINANATPLKESEKRFGKVGGINKNEKHDLSQNISKLFRSCNFFNKSDFYTEYLSNIIELMLQPNPLNRPSSKQILDYIKKLQKDMHDEQNTLLPLPDVTKIKFKEKDINKDNTLIPINDSHFETNAHSFFTFLVTLKNRFQKNIFKRQKKEIDEQQRTTQISLFNKLLTGITQWSYARNKESVWLIYSIKDEELKKKICNDLLRENIRVESLHDTLKPGDSILDVIYTSMKKANSIMILISNNLKDHKWLNYEISLAINEARNNRTRIVPLLADNKATTPFLISDIKGVDISNDYLYNENLNSVFQAVRDKDFSTTSINDKFKLLGVERDNLLSEVQFYEKAANLRNERVINKISFALFLTILSAMMLYIASFLNIDNSNIIIFISGAISSIIANFFANILSNYRNKLKSDDNG